MERSPIHLVGLLNCKNALAMIFHNKNVEDFLIVFNRYIPIHENRKESVHNDFGKRMNA